MLNKTTIKKLYLKFKIYKSSVTRSPLRRLEHDQRLSTYNRTSKCRAEKEFTTILRNINIIKKEQSIYRIDVSLRVRSYTYFKNHNTH